METQEITAELVEHRRNAQQRSHYLIANNLEKCEIKRPDRSERCNRKFRPGDSKQRQPEAQHPNYDRGHELEVNWLCVLCPNAEHVEIWKSMSQEKGNHE